VMVVRVIIAVLDGRVAGGSATPYPYSVIRGANPIQIENVSEFDGTSDSTTMDTSPTTDLDDGEHPRSARRPDLRVKPRVHRAGVSRHANPAPPVKTVASECTLPAKDAPTSANDGAGAAAVRSGWRTDSAAGWPAAVGASDGSCAAVGGAARTWRSGRVARPRTQTVCDYRHAHVSTKEASASTHAFLELAGFRAAGRCGAHAGVTVC
jgi:hypothetical protein